jgi:uncharacterized Zn finger protein (UPF0148 family)
MTDSGRILPIVLDGCKKCGGSLFPDYSGDRVCVNCGWSPPPENIPKLTAERAAHRGKEKLL